MKSILRPVLRFFGAFLLAYLTLIGLSLIPSVGKTCSGIYQKVTQPILQSLLSKAHLQLKADATNKQFIWVEYASKEKVKQQMAEASRTGKKQLDIKGDQTPFNFHNIFLTFWLLLLALMLVSPLPWKVKLFRIILGSLIFYAYSVFKLYLSLWSTFSKPEIGIYQMSDTSISVLRSTLSMMTLGINLLLVLVLWAVLAFDKNNWKSFAEKAASFNMHRNG